MKHLIFTLLLTLLVVNNLLAENQFQTIKGKIVDAQSKYPLYGANITVIGTSLGVTSAENGNFKRTTFLYQSKYKGSNGIEKNTAFNGNYVINFLGGNEFKITDNQILSFDIKMTMAGGRRYTPINVELSKARQTSVYDYAQSYENSFKDYSRFDVKITYGVNLKKVSHEVYLDVQNVFNTQNIFSQNYNPRTDSVVTQYQFGFFPVLNYRVHF